MKCEHCKTRDAHFYFIRTKGDDIEYIVIHEIIAEFYANRLGEKLCEKCAMERLNGVSMEKQE